MVECRSIHCQYLIRLLLPMLCRTLNTWTTIKLRQWWNSLWKEYSHKNSINLILWVIFLNFLMERTRKQKTTVLKSDTVFRINLKILLYMYLSVIKCTMISQFSGLYSGGWGKGDHMVLRRNGGRISRHQQSIKGGRHIYLVLKYKIKSLKKSKKIEFGSLKCSVNQRHQTVPKRLLLWSTLSLSVS